MGKYLGLLLMCILAESTAAFPPASASFLCHRDLRIFLYDLNLRCPPLNQFSSLPIQVDGETFEKTVSSIQAYKYVAVLVYASWCPFSSSFQSKFSTLSSMYPQIQHMMVEQSSAMPSVFSRFGIHSVPSLLVVNRTTRVRYHGQTDLQSLINFYKKSTGLYPMVDMVEEASTTSGKPPKETFLREPYLLVSLLFVFMRTLGFLFPDMPSRIMTLWITYLPRLNLAIFGESRQLLGHVLHVIDIKRIWAKLKLYKARNFHKGARNAQVWASSLASVSLGKTTSSSRVLPSHDL